MQTRAEVRMEEKHNIYKARTISTAVQLAREKAITGQSTHVLITGSLYLIGRALSLLRRTIEYRR